MSSYGAGRLDMASGGQDIWHEVTVLEAQVKRLVNNDLKDICRGENLAVSGVKAVLQQRILAGKLSSIPHIRAQVFHRLVKHSLTFNSNNRNTKSRRQRRPV